MYLERHIHLHHLLKKDTVLHSPVIVFNIPFWDVLRSGINVPCAGIGHTYPILALIHPKSRALFSEMRF